MRDIVPVLVKVVPFSFIVGASMELFMIKTGFYDIVTRKEGERRAAALMEETRKKKNMLSPFFCSYSHTTYDSEVNLDYICSKCNADVDLILGTRFMLSSLPLVFSSLYVAIPYFTAVLMRLVCPPASFGVVSIAVLTLSVVLNFFLLVGCLLLRFPRLLIDCLVAAVVGLAYLCSGCPLFPVLITPLFVPSSIPLSSISSSFILKSVSGDNVITSIVQYLDEEDCSWSLPIQLGDFSICVSGVDALVWELYLHLFPKIALHTKRTPVQTPTLKPPKPNPEQQEWQEDCCKRTPSISQKTKRTPMQTPTLKPPKPNP
eukprot:gene4530-8994_t